MINIVLVGAGKLGSRHLQALSQTKLENTNLFVIDPSSDSLELAQVRFNEMPNNENIHSLVYLRRIEELNVKIIDVAIVATTSDYRKMIVKQLCEEFEIKNLILEKFLFQDVNSYHEISDLIKRKNVNSWVNCPRRQWSFYKDIKSKLSTINISQVDIIGSRWSIATSAIHFIDLIAYLIDQDDYDIFNLNFGEDFVQAYSAITGIRESKYIEFFGTMHGRFKDSTRFNFSCLDEEVPFTISITSSDSVVNIFEESGKCIIRSFDGNGGVSNDEISFGIPFQSELTNFVVEDLLLNEECVLTPFGESVNLHLPVLKAYLEYLNNITGDGAIACPIT